MRRIDRIAVYAPKTLGDLFRCYQVSPEARAAATNTKIQRARAFDAVIHRFHGTMPLAELEERGFRSRVYAWRDTFVSNPASGRQHIQCLNTVLNWAVDRGFMRDNPIAGIKKVPSASRADKVWRQDQIDAFRRVATGPVRRVFDIALWTGLRCCDVLFLRGHQVEEGWISVTPQKTRRQGVKLNLPYCELPILGATMVRVMAPNWLPDAYILRTSTGKPWTYDNFHKGFDATMVRAGLAEEDLHFHDLRGTLITRLHEVGCTEAEAASISGHAMAKGNMAKYVARSRPLAEAAYRKLAAAYPL